MQQSSRYQKLNEINIDNKCRYLLSLFDFQLNFTKQPDDINSNWGYVPDIKNKSILFAYDFPTNIRHEISHMVEMNNPSRCLLPDWGFHTQTFLKPENFSSKLLFSATIREIRVRSIQNIFYDKRKISPINCNLFKELESRLPFGRLKSSKDLRDYADDIRNKTSNDWNFDRIEYEFVKKINFIQNAIS